MPCRQHRLIDFITQHRIGRCFNLVKILSGSLYCFKGCLKNNPILIDSISA